MMIKQSIKLLGMILALSLVLLLVPANVQALEAMTTTIDTGATVTISDVDGDGFYEIGSADELYAFAALVNEGNPSLCAELTADIVVNTSLEDPSICRAWTPICVKNASGSKLSAYTGNKWYYRGVIEGHQYTISGIYADLSAGSVSCGLVGILGQDGSIQNLIIRDSYFCGKSGVGTFAGQNKGGTVMNCSSNAQVTANSYYAGGIVGEHDSGNLLNCSNAGAITCLRNNAGGIAGYVNGGLIQDCANAGDITADHSAGGIVGSHKAGTVTGCENSGDVVAGWNAGGIVGENYALVEKSANHGNTNCTTSYSGGLVGSNSERVIDCYNTGTVDGANMIGGLVGGNTGTVQNCHSVGTLTKLSGTHVGGLIGYNSSKNSVLVNCYFDCDIYTGSMYGSASPYKNYVDCSGLATATFASGEVCWRLNVGITDGTQVWYQTCGKDYPVFSGETVYRADDNTYYNDQQGGEEDKENGEVEPSFDIAFANMTLGNSLAMNFAFPQDAMEDWDGCYAKIVKTYADGRANKEITIPYEDWGSAGINGVAHFALKFDGVAAKEMSDSVFVTIYDGNGNAISNTWEDSVRGYAMRTLNNPKTSEESAIMVVDLLNYGAAAQAYFNYNVGDLANNQMTAQQKALATQDAPAEDIRVKGPNYLGTNLGLESQILMRMAFKGTDTSMYATIEFTNHAGREIKVELEGSEFGSTGAITIDEIVIADGRKPVTVTIYNADGSVYASATDSMESYIARMRVDKYDPLFEAILKFSDSAYNFFH